MLLSRAAPARGAQGARGRGGTFSTTSSSETNAALSPFISRCTRERSLNILSSCSRPSRLITVSCFPFRYSAGGASTLLCSPAAACTAAAMYAGREGAIGTSGLVPPPSGTLPPWFSAFAAPWPSAANASPAPQGAWAPSSAELFIVNIPDPLADLPGRPRAWGPGFGLASDAVPTGRKGLLPFLPPAVDAARL